MLKYYALWIGSGETAFLRNWELKLLKLERARIYFGVSLPA
jgi:hypothetical protein